MLGLDNLITDRTQRDVDRWEYLKNKNWSSMSADERNEWSNSPKGSYGATDLNRVGDAIEYVAEQFRNAGYIVDLKPVKTNWTINDKPTMTQLTDYLENVEILKAILPEFPGTPGTPADMDKFTYEEANAIEQILVDIEIMLQNMREGTWYSNAFMFYSGHDPLPSNLSEYKLRSKQQYVLRTNDNKVFIVR